MKERASRWAVVLAGGEGERMRPFVESWLGEPRPKQYCAFTGGRSMIEHTWDRALSWTSADRVATIIGRGHRRWLEDFPGALIDQPERKDTGPGVFLPLTYVAARDPRATVAIFPSDHFIHSNAVFLERLEEAAALASALPGYVVLLTAEADRPERDYGWLELGERLPGSRRAFLVRRFQEKPSAAAAEELLRRGAQWNTMIAVARADGLWRLGWEQKPAMMSRLQALKPWLGTSREAEALERSYRELECWNFSRDFLEKAADRIVALRMDGVRWCDWGRPARVTETLAAIGRRPAFAPPVPFRPSSPAGAFVQI